MAKETKAKSTPKATKAAKQVDYKSLSEKDLLKKIDELRAEARDLKRNTMLGDVQNVRAYSVKRRELARALTVRNQVREVK